MKRSIVALLAISVISASSSQAAVYKFQGSDTLAGVVTDVINKSGLNKDMEYSGGGSGKGEAALAKGDQGIAPMSRQMKPEIQAQIESAAGVKVVGHVIGLDALSMLVNKSNPIASIDLQTVAKIYDCSIRDWKDVPGSGLSGAINVFRRNDASGTTDAFKHFTGLKTFGACAVVLNETVDIAEKTAKDPMSIGFSGHTAVREGNKALLVATAPGAKAVEGNERTARDFSYPMARNLYIYEVTGARKANEVELKFLKRALDRNVMDPILEAKEFYTLD